MSNDFAPFSIARLPRIEFGSGALDKLPDIAAGYGRHLLLVTGARSFVESEAGTQLFADLRARGLSWEQVRVSGEPSPAFVDATVAALRPHAFDAVVGIGGGSALDAAKAIAGLLRPATR
jgi:alcohol dehydrogenase class IV